MNPNGVLIIDKPAGMTSHDVVGRVRRLLKTKRVGHAGTLDPDATGVLVIAVGQVTRLLPFLPLEPKEYVARASFGAATDTEDASGTVIERKDASLLNRPALEAALPAFVGTIHQIPPMVSALHHEGQRLYDLARRGIVVEREARPVVIHSIAVEDFLAGERAEATLRVVCGGGTYIRTLCADIGAAVGLPTHMKSLLRTRVGKFHLSNAKRLDALEGENVAFSELLSAEEAIDLPYVVISDVESDEIGFGRDIAARMPPIKEGLATIALIPEGGVAMIALIHKERLRALARFEFDRYRPFRVFDL